MQITIHNEAELAALYGLPPDVTEVAFAPGRYHLPRPLEFTGRRGLVLRAQGDMTLTGGTAHTLDWRPDGALCYRAPLRTDQKPDSLVIGGAAFRMARYPHAGAGGIYDGTAADVLDFARRSARPAGAYLHALHGEAWGGMHYEIEGFAADGTPALHGGWQNNRPSAPHGECRFVENLPEALGAPGEFYYDEEAGMLRVCSETPPDSHVTLVTNPYLLRFTDCDDITLIGLRFAHTARTFMADYEPLLRSDWCIHRGGAVFFEGGQRARVHACEFSDIGSNALFFSGACRGARVSSSYFHDLHASAVCFVGHADSVRDAQHVVNHPQGARPVRDLTGVGPKSENHPRDCLAEDCLIHDIGRTEKQVAGVQISMSARITVRHITVFRCPRAAFNVGEGTFGGHLIEHNDAYDTVLETSDHGAFNGWGRDRYWQQPGMDEDALRQLALRDAAERTCLRYNRLRCDHGWDIDLDDGCSNYLLEGNLCLHGGIKLREGFCREVRNNICVDNGIHVHVWYADSRDVVEHNITALPYRPIRMPQRWDGRLDWNILHAPGTRAPRPATELQALSGQDAHSVVLDARFANPGAGDWTVTNDQARLLGFTQPPCESYGVQSAWLRARAHS